ncbi:hypothetical protein H9Q72_009779 [Fusarium xylarioides]|uniref:Uncharacterized protein n=1 Tax=Fusarium xylarioides TaxID=221167 RepID=A0A9P7HM54_9HYPO|nr:hypothetical protein H9Q72_009779 [Fusarium xylarioides]
METHRNFQTLKGKVAIITGASRGLGAGFAYELAKRGAKVVATYTSPSSEKLVKELSDKIASLDPPSECIGVKADLKDESSPAEIVRQAVAAFGSQIDILVNNAGMEVDKSHADITTSDFDSIFYLNVRAPLLLLQVVKPYLPSSGGGRIINISPVGARCGFKNLSLYCASKAALEGLTRSWAAELGERAIRSMRLTLDPFKVILMSEVEGDNDMTVMGSVCTIPITELFLQVVTSRMGQHIPVIGM